MNAIELVGVSKSFRSTLALDDVTLSIGPGVTGLLGPNGAGKTTLMRIVATVLAPDRGDVRVLGHDPSAFVVALHDRGIPSRPAAIRRRSAILTGFDAIRWPTEAVRSSAERAQ